MGIQNIAFEKGGEIASMGISPLLDILRILSAILFKNLPLLLHSSPVAGKPGHDHCRLQDKMHSHTDVHPRTHKHTHYSVPFAFYMLGLIIRMNAFLVISHK